MYGSGLPNNNSMLAYYLSDIGKIKIKTTLSRMGIDCVGASQHIIVKVCINRICIKTHLLG
jgi:hypothetical protein